MNNDDKPSINIYYSSNLKDKSLYDPILWGIEEEGIPYKIESKPLEDSVELGYIAAEDSRLDVGIGIGKDGNIIVHYVKLNKDEPLFSLNIKNNYHNLKKLGANSARLIKRIPFKPFSDDEVDDQIKPYSREGDISNKFGNHVDIEKIVKK